MSPWQLIGIASLSLIVLFGVAILLRNPAKSIDTISLHIAAKPHYFITAALLLTIAGGAFYGFLLFWLLPTYELPQITYFIIIGAFFAQLLVAWFPADLPTKRSLASSLHTLGGVLVGTAMIVCIWIVVLYGRSIPPISYIIAITTAVIGSISYIGVIAGLSKYKKLMLMSEVTMIAFFDITLLALALQI